MDDLTMNIILPVRSDWLITHFASPTEPLPVSVHRPATFAETDQSINAQKMEKS